MHSAAGTWQRGFTLVAVQEINLLRHPVITSSQLLLFTHPQTPDNTHSPIFSNLLIQPRNHSTRPINLHLVCTALAFGLTLPIDPAALQ